MSISKYPRVLVISHNAFNLTGSIGKTLSSIFEGWSKERIAQLYFHNQTPDDSVCNNFFCITEEDIVKNKRKSVGRRVSSSKKSSEGEFHLSLRNKVSKKEVFFLLRNMLWSTRKWDNDNLYSWVEEFSPEVIFLAGGPSIFSYDIANKIADKYSIPIYLYYMDDYILPRSTLNLFWWLNWIWLRKTLKKSLANINKVFVIGEDMANEYSSKLKKECIPIMNSVDIDKYLLYRKSNQDLEGSSNQLKIAYFGGLHLNRWKSLAKVGEVVRKVSKEYMIDISLSIYSSNKPEETILKAITHLPNAKYVGSVNENQIIQEMQKYNALIHIESFDREMIQKTKLSISTKIPEYLASGKPIIAVGPKDISSIRYLEKLGISYIINSLESKEIETILLKMFNEKDKYFDIGVKGIQVAKDNHSMEKSKEIIRKSLAEVYKE
ncbi:MAG TPA: hypothetical protein VEY51_17630 [Chondromyces sp.]|nr:hypothetical protein [Chondromyces sp.]